MPGQRPGHAGVHDQELVLKPADIIAYVSRYMTLVPGRPHSRFTGTPSGVGCFRKPPIYLKHGDECVVEIDGIGRLTNTVQSEQQHSLSANQQTREDGPRAAGRRRPAGAKL